MLLKVHKECRSGKTVNKVAVYSHYLIPSHLPLQSMECQMWMYKRLQAKICHMQIFELNDWTRKWFASWCEMDLPQCYWEKISLSSCILGHHVVQDGETEKRFPLTPGFVYPKFQAVLTAARVVEQSHAGEWESKLNGNSLKKLKTLCCALPWAVVNM